VTDGNTTDIIIVFFVSTGKICKIDPFLIFDKFSQDLESYVVAIDCLREKPKMGTWTISWTGFDDIPTIENPRMFPKNAI